MIVNLEFQKANKTVYKAVQYAGYVGIITGMKPVRLMSIIQSLSPKYPAYSVVMPLLISSGCFHAHDERALQRRWRLHWSH